MTKLLMSIDERWPVFEVKESTDDNDTTIEVSEDFYRNYLYICMQYEKMQDQLKKYYDEYSKRDF